MTGDYGPFTAEVSGALSLAPRLSLLSLDLNSDGKIRSNELSPANATVEMGSIQGSAKVDLLINELDYVDVDGVITNNTAHGGDPFRFVAAAQLSADPTDFNTQDFAGLAERWTAIEILNPDVDGDGTEDFSVDVLLENMRRAAQETPGF